MNKIILTTVLLFLLFSCNNQKKDILSNKVFTKEDMLLAINSEDVDIIDLIVSSGFELNSPFNENEDTFLDFAITNKKQNAAIALIRKGADVNHTDKKGYSSFSKAVNKNSAKLISEFLLNGLDFQALTYRNMNYFEYMLYKKDYTSVFDFIQHDEVYNFFKDNDLLFLYLIYYWDDNFCPIIGNYLIRQNYKWNVTIPYYFYAIDEYSLNAIIWLEKIGISLCNKYLDDRNELFCTPLEYAENKIAELERYSGKDYKYADESVEINELKKIILYLEKL